ncbi:Cephalosporin-C deacetylase [Planctomycetales bacterium 10988]|nr:Cephalosporin-C deacetylase [Planctomycetales bacterium 10988]
MSVRNRVLRTKASWLLAVLCYCSLGTVAQAETPLQPGQWPIERLQTTVPNFRVVEDGPIQSLLYEGEKIDGETTEVFAFYASPKTLGKKTDGEVPGIVLIHGGGGTAFSDWVWQWANRGYAAIAMDLAGHRPPAPKFDALGNKIPDFTHNKQLRKPLEHGGVNHGRDEKFASIGGTIEDDWPYHAVANVMRAHSLLRSFPEVDADKTAVTGISWGGYTTCMVASLDNRFKAAVPVYGCGFLYVGESVQKPAIDALGDRRQAWIAAYDPSSHLGKCKTPMLWVNGTNDIHYVLDSYQKSYSLVKGPNTFRILPGMRHGHAPGWDPIEIGIFVDSILLGTTPLPELGSLQVNANGTGTVYLPYSSETKITAAQLHYTTEDGLRSKRRWKSLPATWTTEGITASGLPEEANTFLITVTDERGAIVSSEVYLR